jgi:hypothetical protein
LSNRKLGKIRTSSSGAQVFVPYIQVIHVKRMPETKVEDRSRVLRDDLEGTNIHIDICSLFKRKLCLE